MKCRDSPDCPLSREYFGFVLWPLEGTLINYFLKQLREENRQKYCRLLKKKFQSPKATSKRGLESLEMTCRDTPDCLLSREYFEFVLWSQEGTLINFPVEVVRIKNSYKAHFFLMNLFKFLPLLCHSLQSSGMYMNPFSNTIRRFLWIYCHRSKHTANMSKIYNQKLAEC